MDIKHAFRVLLTYWKSIVAVVVVFVVGALALNYSIPKTYEATAQLFVGTASADDIAQAAQGNTFTQARVQSYISVATSPDVTGPVVDKLHLNITAAALATKITADAPAQKVLINLHVTDRDPLQAQQLTNAVAQQFATVVENLDKTSAQAAAVVKLTVTMPATRPSTPISPRPLVNLGVGLAVGLFLAIAIAFLRDRLDNRLKSTDDLASRGIPVMGVIPFDKRQAADPVAFRGDGHGRRAEAFRRLRTNLQFVDVDAPPHIIAVTSAVPGEGKTAIALNLAAALAEAGSRVCLIDADLRRPTLANVLGLVGSIGFTTVLLGQAEIEDVLQNAGQNLAVLASGPIPPNPTELLASENASRVIQSIAQQVDYTIIDTAPLLPVADGAVVAVKADATLLVSRVGRTTVAQLNTALDNLSQVGVKPVGGILNMLTRSRGIGGGVDYGYYYQYGAEPGKSKVAADAVAITDPETTHAADPEARDADEPDEFVDSTESDEETAQLGTR